MSAFNETILKSSFAYIHLFLIPLSAAFQNNYMKLLVGLLHNELKKHLRKT